MPRSSSWLPLGVVGDRPLAKRSSVSFTILSFFSTRRKTRRFRPDTNAPSTRPIVDCCSPAVHLRTPEAYDQRWSTEGTGADVPASRARLVLPGCATPANEGRGTEQ